MFDVEAVEAFSDNYIWILRDRDARCLIVDPGDADPVRKYLEAEGLAPVGILLTHHHFDHVGGVKTLQSAYGVPAWGPEDPRIPGEFQVLRDGDTLESPLPGLRFEVISLPGHTMTHIAFLAPGMAFVGDTLFSVGCGRLFEGTPAHMVTSLKRLLELPGDTVIYCAHEYTEANCRFALEVEPDNADLRQRYAEVRSLRKAGRRTVPTRLSQERLTNPFLRWSEPEVREAAERHAGGPLSDDIAVFAKIRAWKDAA